MLPVAPCFKSEDFLLSVSGNPDQTLLLPFLPDVAYGCSSRQRTGSVALAESYAPRQYTLQRGPWKRNVCCRR